MKAARLLLFMLLIVALGVVNGCRAKEEKAAEEVKKAEEIKQPETVPQEAKKTETAPEEAKKTQEAAKEAKKAQSGADEAKTESAPKESKKTESKAREAKQAERAAKGAKKVEKTSKEVKAVIETKFGEMEIKFYPDIAPGHVANFVKLAKEGLYDGTIFHRVIPGFMIQGGDPNTKGPDKMTYGMGGPGHNVKAEFSNTPHKRGILSMARSQHPDSAGSQFFIVVKDSFFLDGQYTVFGEVTKGLEVADQIVNQPRNSRDLPNDRVEMKVRIIE